MFIRNYEPGDFARVKEIHEASGIDYKLPDLSSPLFIVSKVLVDEEGIVRQAGCLYLQAECYLFADHSPWASPEQKLSGIAALDREVMKDAWLKGIDCAVLWLPPRMERFGKRLVEDLGFRKDRDGWFTYSKELHASNNEDCL